MRDIWAAVIPGALPGASRARPPRRRTRIRREVEERDLYPVAAGLLEPDQLVNDVFGAADDLDVAAQRPVLIAMSLPGDRVAAALMRDEPFDGALVCRIEDRRVVLLRLAVGLTADHHRVDDRAQLPAALGPGGLYDGIVRGESGKRGVDLMPAGLVMKTRSECAAA